MGKAKNQIKNAMDEEERCYVPQLPEDIIFIILSRIPPENLRENFGFICKSWHNIIHSNPFIAEHNSIHSRRELLIQIPKCRRNGTRYKTISMDVDDKDKELDFKFRSVKLMDRRWYGRFRPGYNGYILESDPQDEKLLNVLNLVTNSKVTLPPCGSGCPHRSCGCALTFNPFKQQYKVVHLYSDRYGFEIYTLGGPNQSGWRQIPGPFHGRELERPYNEASGGFHWSDPVMIDGQILHWYVGSGEFILSMDANNETITKVCLPRYRDSINKDKYTLLEWGGKLAFLYRVSSFSSTQIDVWVMESFRKQVWVKQHSVAADLISYTNLIESSSASNKYDGSLPDLARLIPVAALRNGGVIMFKRENGMHGDDRLYLYDVEERKLRKFKMKVKKDQNFIAQKSSLCLHLQDI